MLILGLALVFELFRLHRRLAAVNEDCAMLKQRVEATERLLVLERALQTELVTIPLPELADDERSRRTAAPKRLRTANRRSGRSSPQLAGSPETENQIVSLVLVPGIRELSKLGRAVIQPDTRFVELRIDLERSDSEDRRSYRVVVKTVRGGSEIWIQKGIVRRAAGYVTVRVPADRFKTAGAQDFLLTLGAPIAGGNGYEELETCYFRLISK